jgi:thiosulfate/3-mercaptopyruvate sulfurtransferase
MGILPRLLAGATLALGLALVLAAPAARAQRIVDTAGVEAALARGAIVWDVRTEEDYRKGHVPGAVNIDDVLVQLRDLKTEDYLPVAQIARVLGEAGIDPAREIVLYGAKAATGPYFGAVTLQWLGGDRAAVYHGGIDDWRAAGKPLATEPTRLPAVKLALSPREGLLVSTEELKARLRDPSLQILDARTAREFSGDDIRALRGGHIPGAVNIPYEATWSDPDTPRKLARRQVSNKDGFNLKDPAAMKSLFANLDPAKETVVYCQSGVRASVTATVLQELGFTNVRVYDASWLGWGNQLDAPAENVSYFNVGRVNNLLNQLQSRVEELENQVNELKGAKKQ